MIFGYEKSALSVYPCSILCVVFPKKTKKLFYTKNKTQYPVSADLFHPAFDIARSISSFLDATATTIKSSPFTTGNDALPTCPHCGKIYSHVSTMQRHLKSGCASGKIKRFMCKMCSNKYARSDTLSRHIRTVHARGSEKGQSRA